MPSELRGQPRQAYFPLTLDCHSVSTACMIYKELQVSGSWTEELQVFPCLNTDYLLEVREYEKLFYTSLDTTQILRAEFIVEPKNGLKRNETQES